MATGSLLRWIALVAGAELAMRGHLANHGWTCHAGAALFAVALAALAWPTRARRSCVVAAGALFALAAVDAAIVAFAAPARPDPATMRTAAPAPPTVVAAPAPGSFGILVFGGRGADSPPWLALLEQSLRARWQCEQPVAVVAAASEGALGDPAALGAALAQVHRRSCSCSPRTSCSTT